MYKRKLNRGEPSKGMTAARAAKLEALGFTWDGPSASEAAWAAQLAKLKKYKRRHGDCNVPVRCTGDPRLGRWAKEQRSLKKLLDRGEPMGGRGKGKMTAERAAKLEALGFAWGTRESGPVAEADSDADSGDGDNDDDMAPPPAPGAVVGAPPTDSEPSKWQVGQLVEARAKNSGARAGYEHCHIRAVQPDGQYTAGCNR